MTLHEAMDAGRRAFLAPQQLDRLWMWVAGHSITELALHTGLSTDLLTSELRMVLPRLRPFLPPEGRLRSPGPIDHGSIDPEDYGRAA